jgi:2-methylcitrate dehydratase PrpD
LLAERGVKGFAHPLEGPGGFFALYASGRFAIGDLIDELGSRYWIEQLSFKKWPCCRGTHAYIEAAQTLRRIHQFRTDDIVQMTIAGGELQRMLCEPALSKRRPQTVIDAKFSLPFTLAVALRDREVTLSSFTRETLVDPVLLSLAARSAFEADHGHGPRAAGGELTLKLKDGTVLRHRISAALGDAARPLDDATLRAKFVDCAMHAAIPLTRSSAERMADRILNLEQEPDAGALLASAP